MEFRETLLAAQRNQQQQSSGSNYYKAKFDPPKKEQKQRDRLSANIQKFLAQKDEEEKQKKLDELRKRDELLAMRDPKAMRKIQKSLKVFKSANKSVIEDAVDRDNTAVTLEGPDQPDQDDYGYESQEAAALYEKMMQKYSKIPTEPKFPTGNTTAKKDLNGTRERVKHALQHVDDPVPHKRRRKGGTGERDVSPPTSYEPEKEKKNEQSKTDKPKVRKPAPPPIDFNQLLKLAEQKKSEPIEGVQKKVVTEQETERPMTKKQRREYEEEMARRQRRQERLEAEKRGPKKVSKEVKPPEKEKRQVPSGFGRIPKIGEKNSSTTQIDSPKLSDRDKYALEKERLQREKEKTRMEREKLERDREKFERDREKVERERVKIDRDREKVEKERLDRERLEKLKAERERIDRDISRLNKDREKLDRDRERLDKSKLRLENGVHVSKSVDKLVDRPKLSSREQNGKQVMKKSIDLKSQNTYRIDKNLNEKKVEIQSKMNNGKYVNGDGSQGRPVPKLNKDQLQAKNCIKERELLAKQKSMVVNGSIKPGSKLENKRPLDSDRGPPRKLDDRSIQGKGQAGPSKLKNTSFDFDKHINSIGKNDRPSEVKRKPHPDDKKKLKRRLNSDSEYDSEMDDFIDDGDENMDYSRHIKEIFGYDKSKYRDMDDEDDPTMESSFARQQREEYISKKIGILEDLEDMRMEAMLEKKKGKKKRRISDD